MPMPEPGTIRASIGIVYLYRGRKGFEIVAHETSVCRNPPIHSFAEAEKETLPDPK